MICALCMLVAALQPGAMMRTPVYQDGGQISVSPSMPGQQVRFITVDELVGLMKSEKQYVIVDARQRDEYDQAHLPGAVSIPLDLIGSYAGSLDKNAEIVVYCNSYECPISTKATREFMRLGFTDVRDYKGGIKEWKERGYPVYSRQV